MALSVSVLTSRIAGYVTRMSGGVGGALSNGRPYPDMEFFHKHRDLLLSYISSTTYLTLLIHHDQLHLSSLKQIA
jgi:hypothetical protein